ncbi:hypothetical protein GGR57DRAFT_505751 [Xylariaceae sp. FL1272]|nr:hypothetical protein GGR57DRAFT_505751 [Xylariaceae sp. FL1272]
MTTTTQSLESVRTWLGDNGFVNLQDPVAGERMHDMEVRGYPFVSVYGLEFLKYVVLHPRIRCILASFYKRVTLGHSLLYSEEPGRIFRFSPSGPESTFIPMVQIWAKNSLAEYWVDSHKRDLPNLDDGEHDVNEPKEPLLEVGRSSLIESGCKPVKLHFENGGLVIADARTAIERKKGKVIANVFFPDALIPPPKMILHQWSAEMAQKDAELQSDTIRANFMFKNIPDRTTI